MRIVILQPLAISNDVLEKHKQALITVGHSVTYFDSLPKDQDDVSSRRLSTIRFPAKQ